MSRWREGWSVSSEFLMIYYYSIVDSFRQTVDSNIYAVEKMMRNAKQFQVSIQTTKQNDAPSSPNTLACVALILLINSILSISEGSAGSV